MKTLIKILIFIFVTLNIACSNDPTRVIVTAPPVDPPFIEGPEPPAELGKIFLVLYTENSTKFTDGESVWEWHNGKVHKAKSKIYNFGNVVYKLDDNGNTVDARNLVVEPDSISIDPVYEEIATKGISEPPVDLKESGIWIIEHITAQEAYDMGALYKPYTRIYSDSIEYGNWFDNQYECDNIIVYNGDIYNKLKTGAWKSVTGQKNNINHVEPDGFAVYNFNIDSHTATIDGINVTFEYNFFSNAKWWLFSTTENKWYSLNGYTWNGTTLEEEANVLWDFRSKSNVMLNIGVREENGEDVLYWIDCSTGQVYRYVPSVDQYQAFIRLYTGDGETETGTFYKKSLSPVITGNYLYFIFDAQTYRYDFKTGLTSHFIGGVSELWEF
jgi:hypothetical protein